MALLLGRSLTAKMLLVSLSLGLAFALFLDYLQGKELQKTFQAQLNDELSIQAETDRALFDSYVQEVRYATKMIVAHSNFNEYIKAHVDNGKEPMSTAIDTSTFHRPDAGTSLCEPFPRPLRTLARYA